MEEDSYKFYQATYEEYVTHMPDARRLSQFLTNHFANTPFDLDPKIKALKALSPGKRILDYGCSWGYGVYQLAACGFAPSGFERSEIRARYGREKLGLDIIESVEDLRRRKGTFDVVFSNHVLEHLPNIREVFHLFN